MRQQWSQSTDGRRLRILIVVPFGPRFDSKHGGRIIAQLLDKLVERHEVAVVYQRLPASAAMDSDLARRCALVSEVPLLGHARFGSRRAHQKRVLRALAGGLPSPVSAIYSRRFADITRDDRRVAARRNPDRARRARLLRRRRGIGPGCATVLVCHDPGLPTSGELVLVSRGRRRLAHWLDVVAWRRYWSRTLPRADVVVTFTPQDAVLISAATP